MLIYLIIINIIGFILCYLRKYNVLEESKLPILLWIILPIFPFLVTYILWSKYKTIKEIGDNNE